MSNCIKATEEAASQFILQLQYTENLASYLLPSPPCFLHGEEPGYEATVLKTLIKSWFPHLITWNATLKHICNESFTALSVHCGCKMNWAAAYWVALWGKSSKTKATHCLLNLPAAMVTTLWLKQTMQWYQLHGIKMDPKQSSFLRTNQGSLNGLNQEIGGLVTILSF